MSRLLHVIRRLSKGPHGNMVGYSVLATVVVGCALFLGTVYTPAWVPAVTLALAVIATTLTLLVGLANLVRGKINDLSYAISLEAGLRRAGYEPIDLFTDGGAANPSLQLLNFKILRLLRPKNVLELGSGQSTKVLSCYARQNPSAHVLTLEQDRAWVERLKEHVGHDYRHAPLEDKQFACAGTGLRLTASWYKDVIELRSLKFDYILVDGPDPGVVGTSYTPYARAGILHYMPHILSDSFVVVFDDAERTGERMTVEAFQQLLNASKIAHTRFAVHGAKTQVVFCSPDLTFLQSI